MSDAVIQRPSYRVEREGSNLPWRMLALAGGLLSGKYSATGGGPEGARRVRFDFPPVDRERAFRIIDVMREVAAARGTTVPRIALAWLLHRPFVTSVIIGVKSREQLEDNLGAIDIALSDEERARLAQASALPPEYPGWMFAQQDDRMPR